MILKSIYFRFGMTFILCLLYSLLRTSNYSTFVKPLPIVLWLLFALFSEKEKAGIWVVISLCFAFLGDILLDLGPQWLKVGALPFLVSTSLLAWAFHLRLKYSNSESNYIARGLLFFVISLSFVTLYIFLVRQSSEAAIIGAVLFSISVFLLWTSLSNWLFNQSEKEHKTRLFLGFLGAIGIVSNYVLYSLDLYVIPIPRDLVIQVYYWGTAFVTYSFLK